ncbi:translation initiation factor IF-2 isoform X2 [Neofelis nebulosa]|uniref:translation initiation factor IF-2 isoform X2 n=1 Tax=Neofelis nebulosa TaxID=61452 RepID=UPI00272C6382|nr:translation initiation factor IF-2 isoform X2 [Neofelis nebulosa]
MLGRGAGRLKWWPPPPTRARKELEGGSDPGGLGPRAGWLGLQGTPPRGKARDRQGPPLLRSGPGCRCRGERWEAGGPERSSHLPGGAGPEAGGGEEAGPNRAPFCPEGRGLEPPGAGSAAGGGGGGGAGPREGRAAGARAAVLPRSPPSCRRLRRYGADRVGHVGQRAGAGVRPEASAWTRAILGYVTGPGWGGPPAQETE